MKSISNLLFFFAGVAVMALLAIILPKNNQPNPKFRLECVFDATNSMVRVSHFYFEYDTNRIDLSEAVFYRDGSNTFQHFGTNWLRVLPKQ